MTGTDSGQRGRAREILVGLIVSAIFIGIALWSLQTEGITWRDLVDDVATSHYGWILVYVGLLFVLQALRLFRWGVLLRTYGPVPWRRTFSVGAVGHMAIALFPARLGEAVRPLLIVDGAAVTLPQATATVVVERMIDGLLMSLVFVGTVYALRDWALPPEFGWAAHVTAVCFGAAAGTLVLGALIRDRAQRVIGRLLKPIAPRIGDRLAGAIDAFFDAVRSLWQKPRQGALYLALSVLIWAITGASLLPVFWAFEIDLPLIVSFAVLCVMVVGFMIPAGPAAAGTFNVAIILALKTFQVEGSVTFTLAILLHVLLIAVNTFVGVLAIMLGGVTLRSIAGAAGSVWRESP